MNGMTVRPEKFRPDSLRKTKNSLRIRKTPAQVGAIGFTTFERFAALR
ncbi:hypothetical protein ACTUVK_000886 [Stenotrophomonas rhizophila]|jgi:hypothetical protein